MSKNSNHIIIEAKNQYTTQLIDTLAPFIYSGCKSIYKKCRNLKTFQEELCNIPKWNQTVIDGEYERVIKFSKCEWLDKLVESVFVCNVKILTAINSDSRHVFEIKIPDTKNFLHACYVESARNLYIDPYLMSDDENIVNKNMKDCIELIGKSIEKTIRHFIPKQEIIEKCLNDYKNPVAKIESDNEIDGDSYESVNGESDIGSDVGSNLVISSESDSGDMTLEDKRENILMQKPEDLGEIDIEVNERPFVTPEETMTIPVGNSKVAEEVNNTNDDDYFFSSDED